jgi:allantoinase
VFPDGVRSAAVAVSGEKVVAVGGYGSLHGGREEDLGNVALLPGLVDTHVHVNEPGRTEWEGFETATAAAAAGGVTTICDMPLNSLPPTLSADALAVKRAAADGKCAVDVAFWGGAVPGSQPELRALHAAGVTGFKCFLADSGVPEFPPLEAAGLRAAMAELAGTGTVLAVHAEAQSEIGTLPGTSADGQGAGRDYWPFLASRPPRAERRAIETVVSAAAATGTRAHIVHLSAAECVALIGGAKAAGVPLSAETCPHYLFFAAEEIPPGATEFKCCPPIRDAVNREALWRGLEAGVIDCVVSDHSPCPPALKRRDTGDFGAAWGGIASLQLGLAAVWTVARRRGRTLADVARWMATGPAALAGLPGKGAIAVGRDADLVAFDTESTFTVRGAGLQHRSPVTPYEGRTLAGTVRRVWLRGQEVTPGERAGRLIGRPPEDAAGGSGDD